MLAGNIDWPEIMAVLGGGKDDTPEDDESPKPVKRAPKKSPKAAPVAKSVASRARTKR